MTRVVVDASVALSWCFHDEASAYGESVLIAVRDSAAVVPLIWAPEVANGILMGERRKRINSDDVDGFLELLAMLTVVEDSLTARYHLNDLLPFAREFRLTAYDACYLELAIRLGIPLATQDLQLRRVAESLEVTLFPA